jgi:hypothetical protein
MTVDPAVQALCAEFEVEIIPKHLYPVPGQTRAVASIGRLIRNHGDAHARLVLTVLTECKGNNALIDEMTLSAVSNLVLACNDMIEEDASAFLELFDRIPFGPLMMLASELRGIVHQGHALAGMLYLMARRSASLTGQEPAKGVQTAARVSEAAKGRDLPSRRQLREDEKIALGRQLIETKERLPHGHFGPWLAEQGISADRAHRCMKLARVAGGDNDNGRIKVIAA